MTSITYRPVTQGNAFGNPGSLFESAAKSLDKATTGLSTAFDTYRQGSIDARDQRTQDAIASIQAAQTQDQYNALAPSTSQEAVLSNYGVVDPNKVMEAYRNQESAIKQKQISDYNTAQTLAKQVDDPRLQQFKANLIGFSDAELSQAMADPTAVSDTFNNPTLATNALQAELGRRRQEASDNMSRSAAQRQNEQDIYNYIQGVNARGDVGKIRDLTQQLIGTNNDPVAIENLRENTDFGSFVDAKGAEQLVNSYLTQAYSTQDASRTRSESALTRQLQGESKDIFSSLSTELPTAPSLDQVNQVQAELSKRVDALKESKQYSPAQINELKKTLENALGVSPGEEIKSIIRSAPKDKKGFINADDVIALAGKEGLNDTVVKAQIDSYNSLRGNDVRIKEELYQKRREEKYQDALRLEATPSSIDKYINETFKDAGWWDLDDIGRAKTWLSEAYDTKDSNGNLISGQDILKILHQSQNEEDFNKTRANRLLEEFKLGQKRDELTETLNNALRGNNARNRR